MNFDFIKNKKINPKDALKFNIFISVFLWLLLVLLLICLWKFNLVNVIFGEDLFVIWISLSVLEIIFSFLVYKSLVLNFLKKKLFVILFSVIIPLFIFLAATGCFFWWILDNFTIVGGPSF
jgi:hypothetical protein